MRRIKMVSAVLIVMGVMFAAFAGPAMAQGYDPYGYNSYDPYGYNSYDPYGYNSTDLNSALSNYIDYSIYNDLYGYSPYDNSGYGYSPYDNSGYGYSPYDNSGY